MGESAHQHSGNKTYRFVILPSIHTCTFTIGPARILRYRETHNRLDKLPSATGTDVLIGRAKIGVNHYTEKKHSLRREPSHNTEYTETISQQEVRRHRQQALPWE